MAYCVVLVTAPKKNAEAKSLARRILSGKHAACVSIVKNVDSYFWWEGQIDTAREDLLVIKTTRARLPALIRTVKKAHSYSVCEVVALPIIGGNKPYLEWIGTSCRKG
jgi:periplasmic divalent cation tolerance protein